MELLQQFENALDNIKDIATEMRNNVTENMYDNLKAKAPRYIHNMFCGKFVEICKANHNVIPQEIPEAVEVLTAIKVLEKLYPELEIN
jgi:hypothetical protein